MTSQLIGHDLVDVPECCGHDMHHQDSTEYVHWFKCRKCGANKPVETEESDT